MAEKTRTDFNTASEQPILVKKENMNRYTQILKVAESGNFDENLVDEDEQTGVGDTTEEPPIKVKRV